MLTLLFIIILICTCRCVKRERNKILENEYSTLWIILSVLTGLALIVLTYAWGTTFFSIYDQIMIHQKENTVIQENIYQLITNYDNEETVELTNENSVYMIILYPELTDNEFVRQQLNTYYNNCDLIANMKIKKTNNKFLSWLLYFGTGS